MTVRNGTHCLQLIESSMLHLFSFILESFHVSDDVMHGGGWNVMEGRNPNGFYFKIERTSVAWLMYERTYAAGRLADG